MGKEHKKFDVTKKYTTRDIRDENGNVKTIPVSHKIGTITVFSDSMIPDDLSMLVELPEHYLMGDNQLSAFQWKNR